MYKQIIIARKDLNMSPGKLSAQVSHGSMAFLTWMIRNNSRKLINEKCYRSTVYKQTEDGLVKKPVLYLRTDLCQWAKEAFDRGEDFFYTRTVNPLESYELELCKPTHSYVSIFRFDDELYEQWINGEFTKCVLQAKNKNHLLKAKTMAEELGMVEGKDFWLIKDNCRTELEPEEDGRTLTCIGFKPMDSETIDKIGKKFHLYV